MANTSQAFKLPKNTIVFCERSWRLPAAVLSVLVSSTFVWGAWVFYTYTGKDYFEDVEIEIDVEIEEGTVSSLLAREAAAPDMRRLYEVVAPVVVGISGGGANAGIIALGAIIGANGYVLSTLHSVEGVANLSIQVTTPNCIRRYDAQMVKSQPDHDLVLLKMVTPDRFLHFVIAPLGELQVAQACARLRL